jgi:hypothetical protein
MVRLDVNDVSFGAVRSEIHDLLEMLLKEVWFRGYRYKSGQCWGYACRAIRGSSSPSYHSWGLAIDVNAPTNWLGRTDGGDIPAWMVNLFDTYGFGWGGNYSGREDPMHFEFLGSPGFAQSMTIKARDDEIGEDRMTDAEKAAFQALRAEVADLQLVQEGYSLRLQSKPEPRDEGPKRRGWRQADRFLNEPV